MNEVWERISIHAAIVANEASMATIRHEQDLRFVTDLLTRLIAKPEVLGGARDGPASASIIRIAYGIEGLHEQALPADPAELWACEIVYDKLPEHRRAHANIKTAMERARFAGKPSLPPLDESLYPTKDE